MKTFNSILTTITAIIGFLTVLLNLKTMESATGHPIDIIAIVAICAIIAICYLASIKNRVR